MPRFFLNLFNDEDLMDEEGIDLPDLAAAKATAIKAARALIAEQMCDLACLLTDKNQQRANRRSERLGRSGHLETDFGNACAIGFGSLGDDSSCY